jgi:hypothetical protein
LHDIPDDVIERLTILAKRADLSMSAFAVQELIAVAKRGNDALLLSRLPDVGAAGDAVVADVETGRAER